jgi:hypothetical protein
MYCNVIQNVLFLYANILVNFRVLNNRISLEIRINKQRKIR